MFADNVTRHFSRRQMLKSASCGFGYMALRALAAQEAAAASTSPLAPKSPHFAPRAKRVIFLFMFGGPSQMDSFDFKPKLQQDDGKTYTPADAEAPPNAAAKKNAAGAARALLKSPWKFDRHGENGLWVSELFPHMAQQIDHMCILRGMHADSKAHPTAVVQMHTGEFRTVRPSLGSWVLYGLGTENQSLPGFITITPQMRFGGAQNYGAGFLPAAYAGTRIGDEAEAVKDATIANMSGMLARDLQRKQFELLQSLDRDRLARDGEDAALEGVIQSYELAYRMQSSAPDVLDLSNETQETLDMYGIGQPDTDNYGRQCLLARRFAEAGVRFIECGSGHTLGATVITENWDQHSDLVGGHTRRAKETDKPVAALIADLKRRGMLDDTLIVWGGEFGRTPTAQGRDGRDHNATGFTMMLAGGGVKGGYCHGATDDYGGVAVEGRVHVHDLHATMLYALGLDHTKLTYRYSGRDFRLTDIYGNVAKEIFT